ncbi:hypothetical protein DKX38_006984 [Salix brachista]|uniref:Glucose-6-phosphate dehydrogenase C-terminal domain-containing protein n=1 Tax=Salix brachista TaxID=2182728 RepID=A0A5N5MLP4_9ROSI|nr:hypothetical protein DKX38_006984 [Salix brachista]
MTKPDSYEHLLLDFIDGDNHLFMRSDELVTAWNILTPTLQEVEVQLEHIIFMPKYKVQWMGRPAEVIEASYRSFKLP